MRTDDFATTLIHARRLHDRAIGAALAALWTHVFGKPSRAAAPIRRAPARAAHA